MKKPLPRMFVAAFAAVLLVSSLSLSAQVPPEPSTPPATPLSAPPIARRYVRMPDQVSEEERQARGNLTLALQISGDGSVETIELRLIDAETDFMIDQVMENKLGPATLRFSGKITPVGENVYRVDYSITQSLPFASDDTVIQYRNMGWKAVVELNRSASETIMSKNGASYVLSLR
ncbi:hypothetical protein H5P28_13470 [Ruficoccus amylovorans]|uniref:Uncharacterized protein n=1 Tax=Ruficoccus amylovorans TaxID=1804625 RepID=A0A842HFU0_9BACT|nr:hypothetical protein [Ruficoccus amylovorans]MBC2595272.1 hypothetical protein [Ruficoccus amylovorans]